MDRILFHIAALLLLTMFPAGAQSGDAARAPKAWFVAVGGDAVNLGTLSSPWDIRTALAGGKNGAEVLPGDTVWLRGGTYLGSFRCDLRGTPNVPILIRNYNGERVVIDHGGIVGDALWVPEGRGYVWFWGLEVMNSETTRNTTTAGSTPPIHRGRNALLNILGPGVRVINCITHDGRNGIEVWSNGVPWGNARNAEIYGCISYNNGWNAPTGSTGQGFFAQNYHTDAAPSHVRIRDSIAWNNFNAGVLIYGESESAVLNQVTVEGVISFNSGAPVAAFNASEKRYPNIHLASTRRLDQVTVRNCYLYHPPTTTVHPFGGNLVAGFGAIANSGLTVENTTVAGGGLQLWLKGWQNASIVGNTLVDRGAEGKLVRLDTLDQPRFTDYTWNRNRYADGAPPQSNGDRYSFQLRGILDQSASGATSENLRFRIWRLATGFDAASDYAPTSGAGMTNQVVVIPNAYEWGRAHIAVYNWERRTSVTVDLSKSGLQESQRFEIRNVQNLFGAPVATGVYTSTSEVRIPMTPTPIPLPIGFETFPIPSTLPEFGAFVVIPR